MTDMADLVLVATDEFRRAVTPALDDDWAVPARDLDWTCRATACHVADDLYSYALQVLGQPELGYLPVEPMVVEDTATARDIVRVVEVCGRLLQLAVASTPPTTRAWHPCGTSDPAGFAAMGILETLVHGHDITRGLGLDWRPPAELAAPVLARLFPDAPAGEPTSVLLHLCGRAPLGDRPRPTDWRWDSSVRPTHRPTGG